MQIHLAEVLGFCFGVRRAIEQAEAALQEEGGVTTLGPLVHNPQETARLESAGIHVINTPAEAPGGTVVIRAHGARPEIFTELHRRKLHVVDATCPFVTKSQRIARQFAREGYTLVIVGHPDHPEVQGILGYAVGPAFVVTRPEEVAALPASIKPGVLAQTTVNEYTFDEVVQTIANRYPDYVVHNTVCSATRDRQEAARHLATQMDAVYVVGGRLSSNTNRLAEICAQVCPRTFLIETAEEINPTDLVGVEHVGITAGASTPNSIINAVVSRLHAIDLKSTAVRR